MLSNPVMETDAKEPGLNETVNDNPPDLPEKSVVSTGQKLRGYLLVGGAFAVLCLLCAILFPEVAERVKALIRAIADGVGLHPLGPGM